MNVWEWVICVNIFVLPITALHGRGTENVTEPVDVSQFSLLTIPNLEQGTREPSGHSTEIEVLYELNSKDSYLPKAIQFLLPLTVQPANNGE